MRINVIHEHRDTKLLFVNKKEERIDNVCVWGLEVPLQKRIYSLRYSHLMYARPIIYDFM